MPVTNLMRPPVAILRAAGTNRDGEAIWACEMAGGAPEPVHVNMLLSGERKLVDYRMLVLPGGFSYGDDLGAGKLLALILRHRLGDQLREFVASGRPVLGICNGFQVLVKAGLLPGLDDDDGGQQVTLTRNRGGSFECRWVHLRPDPDSPCLFTRGLDRLVYCPVAHGEGRLVARDQDVLQRLEREHLAVLRYVKPSGEGPADYPHDPNGSDANIAGICNPAGNVLGMMPHPEDHIVKEQHPRFALGERGLLGGELFENGIRHAAQL